MQGLVGRLLGGGLLGGGLLGAGLLGFFGVLLLGQAGCAFTRSLSPQRVHRASPAPELLPTLVTRAEQIEPAHHDYFVSARGAPLRLSLVEERFDEERVQARRAMWGLGPVIEYTDIHHSHPSLSPVAAWFLGPRGQGGEESVDSILFRGFDDPPRGSGAFELLAGLSPRWPLSWELCAPVARQGAEAGSRALAWSAEIGALFGLVGNDRDGWELDYIAFQSPSSSLESWWRARAYADCSPLGSTDDQGRYMAPVEDESSGTAR